MQQLFIFALFSEAKRSISCRFDTPYVCGYDMHPFNPDGVVWTWKNDNGFILTDGSRVKGYWCIDII